jgi:beta-lactamase class A
MTQTLSRVLDETVARLRNTEGHAGFYYKNLTTGATAAFNADDTFQAASVIKVPLFAEVLRQARLGNLSMDDRLVVHNEDKVPSCGALNSFTDEPALDIRTLCRLMITLSDNTATNVLIGRITIPALADGFAALGLAKTRIHRKLFDANPTLAGIINTFSPRELGELLERMERGTLNGNPYDEELKQTLLKQQINHKIPGIIGRHTLPIAHKTGEDDTITHDVGIVYAPEPFIVCFASEGVDVPDFEQLIREQSYALYQQHLG